MNGEQCSKVSFFRRLESATQTGLLGVTQLLGTRFRTGFILELVSICSHRLRIAASYTVRFMIHIIRWYIDSDHPRDLSQYLRGRKEGDEIVHLIFCQEVSRLPKRQVLEQFPPASQQQSSNERHPASSSLNARYSPLHHLIPAADTYLRNPKVTASPISLYIHAPIHRVSHSVGRVLTF